ncbi:MAG: single-stranded-DNA-specific exonuclease RecJ, partial [Myxococcales bacterium]
MARTLASTLGLTVTAARVLVGRGQTESEAVRRFLDPRLADLTPPSSMKDRAEAVSRIARAVRAKERICVFGDYDADGVTSAALLTDVLETLGGTVTALFADRFAGGYGLSDPALARVFDTGASLLVTCDCGSGDQLRLVEARRRGMDVVVIDHHQVPSEELAAVAFLNPHRPDCAFPYKGFASVGLAFSVAAGVRAELGRDLDLRPWLDLVAIGTIADVAPLDGDNRALVRAGLAVLGKPSRPGVQALIALAKSTGPITGEDVAYRVGPRMNAPGRLGKADPAYRLLRARSAEEATSLAIEVDTLCTERKAIDRAMLAEALVLLEDPELARLPVIVVGKQGWHPGVVGIVAGRLTSRFGKPSVVVALNGATGRGSARGPGGVSLYDALTRCKEVLVGYGGHHAAAGVHLESEKLGVFRERFAEACEALGWRATGPRIPVADACLDEADAPRDVLRDFERFEPCGASNVAPLVVLDGAEVHDAREMRGGHLRFDATLGGHRLGCFGFDFGLFALFVIIVGTGAGYLTVS